MLKVCVCAKMFVEIWLHHYSLDMYQKLQSPQVKVREIFLSLPSPLTLHCSTAQLAVDWLTTPAPSPPPPSPSHLGESPGCWPAAVWLVILSLTSYR